MGVDDIAFAAYRLMGNSRQDSHQKKWVFQGINYRDRCLQIATMYQ
jgi:hypothetical protein